MVTDAERFAAIDAASPPTPLHLFARRIERMAQVLTPAEYESLLNEFHSLFEYVMQLERFAEDHGKARPYNPT